MRRRFTLLVTVLSALTSACDTESSLDASTLDASADAPLDTGPDAARDAGDAALDATDAATTDAGDDAGSAATLDDVLDLLCPAIARIRCSGPWDCGCPNFGPRPDEATCLLTEEPDCRAAFPETSLGAAIASGAVDTSLSALATCLAELESSYDRCSGRSNDLSERCVTAFVNREAALGDSCIGALCAGGTGVCSQETGQCVALPGAGMDCDTACGVGLRCISGTCAPAGDASDACFSDADCASDLSCSSGLCRSLGAVGASCSVSGECALGLRCDGGACTDGPAATCTDEASCASLERCGFAGSEGRCRALVGLGEACDTPGSCAVGRCDLAAGQCVASAIGDPCGDRADCPEVAVCAFSGACELPGGEGEACVRGFGVTGCEDGLICSEDLCVPLPSAGETCIDSQCAVGLACRLEPSGPRCDAPRVTGEPCMIRAECGAEGRCVTSGSASACQPRGTAGTPCTFDEDCDASLVCSAAAGLATCQPRAPIGSLCAGSGCIDGAYCRAEMLPAFCEARVCDHFSFIEL